MSIEDRRIPLYIASGKDVMHHNLRHLSRGKNILEFYANQVKTKVKRSKETSK
jgi:hypothetical protein